MTAFDEAWSLLKQMDAYGKQGMQQTYPHAPSPEAALQFQRQQEERRKYQQMLQESMGMPPTPEEEQQQQALRGPYK